MNKVLSKEEYLDIVNKLGLSSVIDKDFVYSLYITASEGIEGMVGVNQMINVQGINPITLLEYCVGEYLYIFQGANEERKREIIKKEEETNTIASIAADKYLSLGIFGFQEQKLNNRFSPEISSMDLYLNFILNILKTYQKNDPGQTLIIDLLNKSISIARCILRLLINGYETEAFSLWRTLHECECTLVLLNKYDKPLISTYLKHMKYGIAFGENKLPKEEVDAIFVEIKDEMKKHELKSKDMKKFIEYGWLYAVPGVDQINLKLNFKDGLETISGLDQYKDLYTKSSELIHSTPLLIYSNKQFFYFASLLCLYESFFRIEKVFLAILENKSSENLFTQYQKMRAVYYSQLVNIHKRESHEFVKWQKGPHTSE